jgi:hypothetical protein
VGDGVGARVVGAGDGTAVGADVRHEPPTRANLAKMPKYASELHPPESRTY